ncbi:MAG: hypothetical protein GY803_04125, partial [Chloroflexi bacterium]|nr:hypothetical protein [Chloroflexota bacterium]
TIVWWTMPIATAADDRGNDEKEIFNGLMRDYCDVNICVLFDIADIESHDPDGNPVVSPAGYEAMWGDYASDGAHLNETGRQRVAAAFWHLFARIAGWDPESPEPSFTLGITPELVEVEQGRTAVYTISVQSVGGFSQSVQLSATGLPTDTAVSWSANPLPPDQSATISATVSDTASVGDYLFAVIGSANMLAKTVTATLNVLEAPPEPDFALDVTPEWAETEQGRTAVYTVSVQSINGFTQLVQMETAALPEETAVSWQENPLASDQSTTMTVTVGVVVPTGDYLFNVIGAAGALTDTVTATLRVREPSEPGFVMSVTPESVNVIWGAAAVYTITVYGVGGFTQLVQLDTAGLPGGTAVSWQDNPLSPNETTIMTVAVDAIVPCADYPFNVVGTAGTLTETSSITLGVRRPTYLPLILRDYTSP